MDSYVALAAPVLRGCWGIPVGIGVFLASRVASPGGLYIAGLYFAAFGAYCLANFARCREAHCIITGLGWTILTVVTFTAAALHLAWFGPIWNTFLIVFVIGHGFELIWAAVRHTHVLNV